MNWLTKLFKRKKWEKVGVAFTYQKVEYILKEVLKSATVDLRDLDYRALPLREFMALAFEARPYRDSISFESEIYDCDNYAVGFMADVSRKWAQLSHGKEALAFGYISAYNADNIYHAFIWQMDDKGSVNFIEPQTDSVINWTPQRITIMEG
jgi:hypothetical protein